MKKLLAILVTAILAVTACLGFTACGESKIVNPREKTITIGYTDYEPMNYTENGELKGFDTELAIMTFNALGYDVRFRIIKWENKYVDLNGGTIDCIWNGFTSNGEDDGVPRNQSVDFSYNYMQNAQCIVRKNTTAAISSYADFANKSVAFETGSAGQSLIEDNTENINVLTRGQVSQMDAITAVNGGTADYAVVDVLLAQKIVAQSAYSSLVINEGLDIDIEYYAIGFKKGSELTAKVNIILETFGKTGYLTALAEKYGLENSVITDFTAQKILNVL